MSYGPPATTWAKAVQEFSFWLDRKLQALPFVFTTTTAHTATRIRFVQKAERFPF
jgi:hypothetical protein